MVETGIELAIETLPAVSPIQAYPILDDRGYVQASDDLFWIVAERKARKAILDPYVSDTNKAHKAQTARREEQLKDLDANETVIKSAMARYARTVLEIPDGGATPLIPGISLVSKYTATIDDQDALIRHIAANLDDLRHLIKIDQRELDKMAAGSRSSLEKTLPGITVVETLSVSVRAPRGKS